MQSSTFSAVVAPLKPQGKWTEEEARLDEIANSPGPFNEFANSRTATGRHAGIAPPPNWKGMVTLCEDAGHTEHEE